MFQIVYDIIIDDQKSKYYIIIILIKRVQLLFINIFDIIGLSVKIN